MGWFSDLFGGGGSSNVSTTSVSNNTTQVDTTSNVVVAVDMSPLQKAIEGLTGVQEASLKMVSESGLSASAIKAQMDKTVETFQSHLDDAEKRQFWMAVGGAALAWFVRAK